MKKSNANRFTSILGEDYNLFKKIMPNSDHFQEEIGKIIKNYTKILKGEKIYVVEGGIGTGLTALRILKADKRIKVIGIDNEKKYLDLAKKILNKDARRIILRNEDLFEALKKIPDKTIDIFASAWMTHNTSKDYRKKLFPEITRILKKGGLFVNCDKFARNDKRLHAKDLKVQRSGLDILDSMNKIDLKNKWIKHWQEDERNKFTQKEQFTLLKNNFNKIKISNRKNIDAIIFAIKK